MKEYTKESIIRLVEENDVEFIRLQFADISGRLKNVAITKSQLEKALDNKCTFDGSSVEGFVRIEESDMYLRPDPTTFALLPWRPDTKRVARLICDVYTPEGYGYEGDSRLVLRSVLEKAEEKGYEFKVGPECEFFLFHMDEDGRGTTVTHDEVGYFDIDTVNMVGSVRREICLQLEEMGFEIEASHHEVAPAQHEIDFKYDDALCTADNIMTFKMVVKAISNMKGVYATFMPKPLEGVNGSGMHLNMSLMKEGENAFYDPKDPSGRGLSELAYYFMAGLMHHAKALTAICNPLVNSYKRLIAGYEAPVYIAWSSMNRSPLIRVPAARGMGTRIEFRSPDPSANPYLALAACLIAGLEGIERKMSLPAPANSNIFEMSEEERTQLGIEQLPANLNEALRYLAEDEILVQGLGEELVNKYIAIKKKEWNAYSKAVTDWEVKQYLNKY